VTETQTAQAPTAPSFWVLTSTWDDFESNDATGAWTTVYASEAEAAQAAQALRDDVTAEGNDGTWTEQLLTDTDGTTYRRFYWEAEDGLTAGTVSTQPLRLGRSYGT
jgi:hypothetical protein